MYKYVSVQRSQRRCCNIARNKAFPPTWDDCIIFKVLCHQIPIACAIDVTLECQLTFTPALALEGLIGQVRVYCCEQ